MRFSADGSGVRISQVADGEIVSWREHRIQAHKVLSRTERDSDAFPLENILHITAGEPVLGEGLGDHNNQEGEVDARVLAPLYSSAERRFRKWENVELRGSSCHASR